MITRRKLALGGIAVAGLAVAGLGAVRWRGGGAEAATETFEVSHTPEEWRKLLTADNMRCCARRTPSAPFTSPLNNEKRKGTFACAGCDLPLFSSETKFDSGTGWPSFCAPLDDAVGTSQDYDLRHGRATKCIAAAAAAISAMCSTTARSPPACAIA